MQCMKITNKSLSIVTGGTGGLGKSISHSVLNSGGILLLIARDEEKINSFEDELNESSKPFFYKLQADLTNSNDLEKIEDYLNFVLKCEENINDVFLFNNASTIDPIALIKEVSFHEISNSLTLNIASAYSMSSMLLRLNDSQSFKQINIINISSGVSINPVSGWSAYCISKSGLNMLSKCIALEYSNNENTVVFSLAINPGPINTDMQKKIRDANPLKIPASKKFDLMFKEGRLQDPNAVTDKLFRILAEKKYINGDFIDFNLID